ncbi:hypothetical protein IKF84_02345 [Candidatus Saccharibacteria bacterium]|nr:hypothetical protein [Candidatus Saccharibacteria bacterium]
MDNKSSFGMNGQPVGPIVSPANESPYTAAFTQPISTPMGEQSEPTSMGQPIQPAQPMTGQPIQPGQPMMSEPIQPIQPGQSGQAMPGQMPGQAMPGQMPGVAPQMPDMEQNPITGQPMMMQSAGQVVVEKKDNKALIKTIAIIALSLTLVTFIGLFLWMFTEYSTIKSDVDGRIAKAVYDARNETTTKLEEEFAEREKFPYRPFAGPADYGSLTFEYPDTWSVYIANDASGGGDFEAYLNPGEVYAVSNTTICALNVKIVNAAFDSVVAGYQPYLEAGRDGTPPAMRLESVTIGQDNDIVANLYTGAIPNTEFQGYIIIFKLRDKTVILQTDSVLFEGDYQRILSTVRVSA